MSLTFNDQTYYRTAEVCDKVGVSKSTLFRWFKDGVIEDTAYRDRGGWRLYTEADLERIIKEAHKIE